MTCLYSNKLKPNVRILYPIGKNSIPLKCFWFNSTYSLKSESIVSISYIFSYIILSNHNMIWGYKMYQVINMGLVYWIIKFIEIDITGGMKTISMNKSIAEIRTAPKMSLSQASAEALEDQVLHSATLRAHTRKMV